MTDPTNQNSPFSDNRRGKDMEEQVKNLNPKFDVSVLVKRIEQQHDEALATVPHVEILQKLINELEEIDFQTLAFPEVPRLKEQLKEAAGTDRAKDIQKRLDKLKLEKKHYLILAIENLLETSKNNEWDLCKNHDFIYLYNGAFWNEIDKESFQKFLGEAAEKMAVPKFDSRLFVFREYLFKQFLATAYLPTPEPDKDKVFINLQNGTFEITPDGNYLRPFDSSDFITYQLPFKYNPEAKAPIFQDYLNKVLPDIERQRVLAEYLGFIFIKHGSNALKEEKALILYGTGANGKSVFFEVVNALIGGENISNYSLQSLTNENGYFRAKIANKLVNYASEINGKLEATIFKQLVSGEPVEARLPYGQPFTLKQYAKLIFNSNELPKDVEHTNAYFRRFLIIPFDVTIPEHEQDKELHQKIISKELSGVFNWVLEGLERLLSQKRFSECRAAQNMVQQYKVESDSVQMFLNENEYKSSISSIPLQDLFNEYKLYCSDNGYKFCSKRTFSTRLKGLNFQIERLTFGMAVFVEKGTSF